VLRRQTERSIPKWMNERRLDNDIKRRRDNRDSRRMYVYAYPAGQFQVGVDVFAIDARGVWTYWQDGPLPA
jgi:hypothetical protein